MQVTNNQQEKNLENRSLGAIGSGFSRKIA